MKYPELMTLLLAYLIQLPTPAIATDVEKGHFVSIISENDIYAPKAQDRHYSNGLRIAVGATPANHSWLRIPGKLFSINNNSQHEFSLGHNIYTPEFYLATQLQANDRPYAGWLYGEWLTTQHRPGLEKSLALNIGVVGPWALGEEIQKLNHSIIDDPKPRGWSHQLRNEPALLLRYRQSWFTPISQGDSLSTDLVTRAGINLGNVFTDAAAGLALRLGNHLPEADIPMRVQPGLSGNSSRITIRPGRFDWMIYAEAEGRFVARNIFLDGNTFSDSHSVDRKALVGDLGTGLLLGFGQFRHPLFLSFSLTWRSREFQQQRGTNNTGSAQIGILY